jgi:hypothetical protein
MPSNPTPLSEALAKQCGKLQRRAEDGLLPVSEEDAAGVLSALEIRRPPPYLRRNGSTNGMTRYELVEPSTDEQGRPMNRYHKLGVTDDPRKALARLIDRLREREAWAGPTPSAEEARVIEVARSKIAALSATIAKMGAKPNGIESRDDVC